MPAPLVLLAAWAPQASIALLTLWVRYGPTISALMTEGATPVSAAGTVRVATTVTAVVQENAPAAIQQAHRVAKRMAEEAARGQGFGGASLSAVYRAARTAAEKALRRGAPRGLVEKETHDAATKKAAELARAQPPKDPRTQAIEAWNEWLDTYRAYLTREQLEEVITLVKSTQRDARILEMHIKTAVERKLKELRPLSPAPKGEPVPIKTGPSPWGPAFPQALGQLVSPRVHELLTRYCLQIINGSSNTFMELRSYGRLLERMPSRNFFANARALEAYLEDAIRRHLL
jgi:hypothetical protein